MGPAFLAPKRARVASSVRLAALADGRVGLYFICHTGLVGRFRNIYPHGLDFGATAPSSSRPAAV